jgi:hypothetical protein
VPVAKLNRLMLFRERVAVCCENHTEHTEENTTFLNYSLSGGGHDRMINRLEGSGRVLIEVISHYTPERTQENLSGWSVS